MGKQARARRERQQRREASRSVDEATLATWSQIPDEALSGPCNRPECALVHCLDPWVTELALSSAVHDGPLVFVNYAVYPDGDITRPVEHRMRINGHGFAVLPTGALFREDPAEHGRRMEALGSQLDARYGAGARLAFFTHISRSPQHLELEARNHTPDAQA